MVVEIELSKQGKKHAGQYVALVSDIDADLEKYNWIAIVDKSGKVYAYRETHPDGHAGINVTLHRVVMERILGRRLVKGEIVDHISGESRDNQRENLRLATIAQNNRNRRKQSGSSRYKGVRFYPKHKNKPYRASISYEGKAIFLGNFKTEEEAHAAYCEAAIKYHGEFANFGGEFTPVAPKPEPVEEPRRYPERDLFGVYLKGRV